MAFGGWYTATKRPTHLQFDRESIYILDGGFASSATEFVQDAAKEIDKIYQRELKRQQTTIELIASENFASDAVMKLCKFEL